VTTRPGAALDPADAGVADRGIAALRLALLPIALIALPTKRADLAIDAFPILLAVFAVYAIAMLTLSVRRPQPSAPLGQALCDLVVIAALVFTSGGASSPLRFAFYVLPIIAALRLSPRLTATWTALALAAYVLATVPHPSTQLPGDLDLLAVEALTLGWVGAAAVMLSALVGRRERMLEDLAASRRRLVQQSLDAAARERRRLAQALHDDAIQNVLLARQEVTDLARGVAGAEDRARAALDETHRQLREEVFAMHPVGLERAGLGAVLRHLADDAARRGHFIATVQVDRSAVDARNDLLVSSARELLTNAAKHAHAAGVDVTVHCDDGWLRLTVVDDGDGFAAQRLGQALADGHIGLAATAERIRAVGGQITIDSTPTAGTTIIATFPAEQGDGA